MSLTASAASLAGKRILVVEDTAIVAQELEFILKRLQCTVVGPVGDIDAALNLLKEDQVDGVILDVNLHGSDSYPVADDLDSRGIPFVFTTGYGTGSMPEKYHHYPRLEKPFGVDDLAQKLKQMFV